MKIHGEYNVPTLITKKTKIGTDFFTNEKPIAEIRLQPMII